MTNKYQKAFLDYYTENNLSPVTQDISDLEKHFNRRDALYKHLGLPSSFVKGMNVIEVGPGTGQNALFTLKQKPREFTLLDGNAESIRLSQLNLQKQFEDTSNVKIIQQDFLSYTPTEQYDLTLCEGTLPGQNAPSVFAKKLGNITADGGMLIITCIDEVSILADQLRKVGSAILLGDDTSCTPENVQRLREFCSRSMNNLKGMSRLLDDWILDVMLHPLIGELFSIGDAIDCLKDSFNVHASSPDFITDWRWYKDLTSQDCFNDNAQKQYILNIHNLLDYRFVLPENDGKQGYDLLADSKKVYASCQMNLNEELSNSNLSILRDDLKHMVNNNLSIIHPETAAAILEFTQSLENYLETGTFTVEMPKFEQWFSRGQQYLSFIKRENHCEV